MLPKLKLTIAVFLPFFFSHSIFAQGFTPTSTYFSDDVWFFGTTGVGIQFKKSGATFTPYNYSGVSKVVAGENSLSVSTPACDGGFVFYTSHSYVYNAKHEPMKGGINPSTDPGRFYGHNSVADGLAACYIGDNKYFLVSSSNAYEAGGDIGLYYYTVDMNGDSGFGSLSGATTLESTGMSESVEIIPIPGKYDEYWLVYYHVGRKQMVVCKITPSGITKVGTPLSYSEPNTHTYQFKRSPTNDVLALALPLSNQVTIFNFNPATGVISKRLTFNTNISNTYGVEFSPSGKYLFVATWNANKILQYDLTTSTIVSSGVFQPTTNGGGGLKLGPDGRIYVMRNVSGNNQLGVIKTPNQVVSFSNTAHYDPNGFTFSTVYTGLALSTGITPPAIDPPSANQAPQPKPDFAETTSKTSVTVAVVANDIDPNKVDPNDKSGLFLVGADFVNPAHSTMGTVAVNGLDKTVTFTPSPSFLFTEGQEVALKYRIRNNGAPVGLCSDDGRLTITIRIAKLAITLDKETITEGGAGLTATVCLPLSTVAPKGGLLISLERNIASSAGSEDYKQLPGISTTIQEGQRCATFTIEALTDLVVEGEEKLMLEAKATAAGFLVSDPKTVSIVDVTPGGIIVEKQAPLVGNAKEPNINGSFRVRFEAAGVTCKWDVKVYFTLSGVAVNGVDYELIAASETTIPAGSHYVDIPIVVHNNYIVEGDRGLKITIDRVEAVN